MKVFYFVKYLRHFSNNKRVVCNDCNDHNKPISQWAGEETDFVSVNGQTIFLSRPAEANWQPGHVTESVSILSNDSARGQKVPFQ